MNVKEQRFYKELDKEIGKHLEKQEIMTEYELHIYELIKERSNGEEQLYEELVERLGTPKEIAAIWRDETAATPKKMQWLFVFCNILIFMGGGLLTVSYNVFHWDWTEHLWTALTNSAFLIMLVYTFFWGLLGYEIGKEFGQKGHKHLKKTFLISIIPNLLLMYLTVFKLIPYDWFQPLLNVPFIIVCIVFTALLYPVCLIGYRWGRKSSV
ncbi:HAAS signaling domain-containing protein [Oceanobacillus halophilus]|uniref:DUF1129 family protein n=1 Tax=Oceanobacillus halophilus TaxID=930130 RepID=A0A494ZSI4_9BACI|nr:hypothetical protein [Oceanobacillus halophilus]RKQ28792.1 hypothetical protein D8M06_18350 [Oceanobacillus halophilus]